MVYMHHTFHIFLFWVLLTHRHAYIRLYVSNGNRYTVYLITFLNNDIKKVEFQKEIYIEMNTEKFKKIKIILIR